MPLPKRSGRCTIEVWCEMRPCLLTPKIGNDPDAGVAQHLNPAPLVPWMRVDQRDVDGPDAPSDHLLGARGRALMERARFEGDECRHVFQSPFNLPQRHRFRMRLVRGLGEATGYDRSVPDEDAAD